jgi:hypothetical protein
MYIEKHKEAMQVFCQFHKTLVGSYGYLINPTCDRLQGDRVPVLTANDMFLHTTRPLQIKEQTVLVENDVTDAGFTAYCVKASKVTFLESDMLKACGKVACDASHEDGECYALKSKTKPVTTSLKTTFTIDDQPNLGHLSIMSKRVAKMIVEDSLLDCPDEIEVQLLRNKIHPGMEYKVLNKLVTFYTNNNFKFLITGWAFAMREGDENVINGKVLRCSSVEVFHPAGNAVPLYPKRLAYKEEQLIPHGIRSDTGEFFMMFQYLQFILKKNLLFLSGYVGRVQNSQQGRPSTSLNTPTGSGLTLTITPTMSSPSVTVASAGGSGGTTTTTSTATMPSIFTSAGSSPQGLSAPLGKSHL